MVLTIIGAVFAGAQFCLAAIGAGFVRDVLGEFLHYDCDFCERVFVSDVHSATCIGGSYQLRKNTGATINDVYHCMLSTVM